jgi:hypothetical protein
MQHQYQGFVRRDGGGNGRRRPVRRGRSESATLTFNAVPQSLDVTLSESNYTGPFTAADSGRNPCVSTGIATIQQNSNTSFTVTSHGAGNCAFVMSDDHGQSAEVQIFVTTGTLTVNPTTIGFADISTLPTPAPFTATDPNNVGAITATSTNTAVATVLCQTVCTGTSGTFIVTPVGNGLATISVVDAAGGQAAVSIGVGQPPLAHKKHKPPPARPLPFGKPVPVAPAPPPATPSPKAPNTSGPLPVNGQGGGTLTVSTTSVTLTDVLDSRTISASEPGFAGLLGAVSSNPRIATVTVAAAGPFVWNIVITAHGTGAATISVSDGRNAPRIVMVRVFAPEPRTRVHPPL